MNVKAHNLSFIELNMSILPIFMLHNIQQKAAEEIKIHEETMYSTMKKFRSQATDLEKGSFELRQQKEQLSQDKQKLQEDVEATYRGVLKVEIEEKMAPEAMLL